MEPIEVFKALSNEARLQILDWLRDPEAHFEPQGGVGVDLIETGVCVSQITTKLGMTQSTTSQYMSVLQRAGLVHATRIGKWTYYKRNEDAIQRVASFIQREL
ncbi:ArsR/SmtB family transcription factor [Paenibacillus terreus]|uniref:ArsR/SmtB family transcription factor n=1 Tax=Paenibacillus terreus TaxID=1387834 RepID=A0ABV5BC67_9BACL